MEYMVSCANEFVNAMLDAGQKLREVEVKAGNKERLVKDTVSALKDEVENMISSSNKEGNSQIIREVYERAASCLLESVAASHQKIEEGTKGMKFIRDFEKTFIVSVFGKVKAGKSYLGNFIMGNTFRKQGVSTKYDDIKEPGVEVYDRGKRTLQKNFNTLSEDGFSVGSTETTSVIQWLELGGLSWFDTPGIGSITKENEELAKEYVKNSDLVIFATNSDAAGTRQEFQEIEELVGMKKPILMLITMSDTVDEDVDEEGNLVQRIIPKTEKDRIDVEKYMRDELEKYNKDTVLNLQEFITVSARLANVAIEQKDDDLFRSSNMDKLYHRLIDITVNEAAQMKLKTPDDRINKMIDAVIGTEDVPSLVKMKAEVEEICQDFLKTRNNMEELRQDVLEGIRNRSRSEILRLLAKLRTEITADSNKEITGNEISKKVLKIVNESIDQICAKELKEILGDVTKTARKHLDHLDISVSDMKMKKETISYTVSDVRERKREPKGLIEHIGAFFGKEYTTTKIVRSEKSYSVDVGINDSEIIDQIMSGLDGFFHTEVDAFLQSMVDGYYEPVSALQREVSGAVEHTIKTLNSLKKQ